MTDVLQTDHVSSSYNMDNMDVDFDFDEEAASREIVGNLSNMSFSNCITNTNSRRMPMGTKFKPRWKRT